MQWYSFQTQCGWLLYSWIYTSRVVFSSHLPLLRVVQRCHTRRPPWQRSSRVGDTRPGCWGRRHTGRYPSCSSDQGTWSRHKSDVPWQHEWRLTPSVLALPEMHSPLLEVKKNGESNFFFFISDKRFGASFFEWQYKPSLISNDRCQDKLYDLPLKIKVNVS